MTARRAARSRPRRPPGPLRVATSRPATRLALGVLAIWLGLAAFGPSPTGGADPTTASSLAAVAQGARESALIVAIDLGLALPLGWLIGVVVGAGGKGRETLLSRGLEMASFWPTVVLVPILAATVDLPRPVLLGAALAVAEGGRVARLLRAEILRARAAPYVAAARALGASRIDLFRWHIVPHATGPLLVAAAFAGATAVATDTALAFLGLGGDPPGSWGGAIAASLAGGSVAIGPLVAVVVTTAAFYGIAESVAAAQDPRPSLSPS